MIDGLLETYGNPEYVPHMAIDLHLEGCPDLDSTYTKNVELMARLDAENQVLAQEMSRALSELQRSQKRTKYKFDLLKSDIHNFEHQQKSINSELKSNLQRAIATPVLGELKRLGEQRDRIVAVNDLLKQASESTGTPEGDIATVLRGTQGLP